MFLILLHDSMIFHIKRQGGQFSDHNGTIVNTIVTTITRYFALWLCIHNKLTTSCSTINCDLIHSTPCLNITGALMIDRNDLIEFTTSSDTAGVCTEALISY